MKYYIHKEDYIIKKVHFSWVSGIEDTEKGCVKSKLKVNKI